MTPTDLSLRASWVIKSDFARHKIQKINPSKFNWTIPDNRRSDAMATEHRIVFWISGKNIVLKTKIKGESPTPEEAGIKAIGYLNGPTFMGTADDYYRDPNYHVKEELMVPIRMQYLPRKIRDNLSISILKSGASI